MIKCVLKLISSFNFVTTKNVLKILFSHVYNIELSSFIQHLIILASSSLNNKTLLFDNYF